MAEMLPKHFRASHGLDAAKEKIINVADADRTVMSDGVNVSFLFQENTIQHYNPKRDYIKGFAVIHNNRIWVSNQPVKAEPFSEAHWDTIRVDPKWKLIQSGIYNVQSGDYLTVDTNQGKNIELNLPTNAMDGDTVCIKDLTGRPGYTDVEIKTAIQSISYRGAKVKSIFMSIPFSEMLFVYNNKLWNLYVIKPTDYTKYATPDVSFDAQSGDNIVRRYTKNNPITINFPKNANHGDMITFSGMDNTPTPTPKPYFHLELNTFDEKTSIISVGLKQVKVRRPIKGHFIFDSYSNLWSLYDNDTLTKLRVVNEDTTIFPNDHILVANMSEAVANKDIKLTLPTEITSGDTVQINLTYLRKNQKVTIISDLNDGIMTDLNNLQFPRRSEYPLTSKWPLSKSLTLTGDDYVTSLKLTYHEQSMAEGRVLGAWYVDYNDVKVERVDAKDNTTRQRLGVIALASQAQANIDHENKPEAELAITPQTLSNRVALTNRRGIARLATIAEVNGLASNGAWHKDTIVTPETLDKKQATETMRGLLEVATQAEANGDVNDTDAVTPKKLHNRTAEINRTGIISLVTAGGKVGLSRDVKGTLIYDFDDYRKAVTPKTLYDMKSTREGLGLVYLATETEVIAGVDSDINHPLVVTPKDLHAKTATETRIGFTQIATQTEVNGSTDDFKYITPKKLHNRTANNTRSGITFIATQAEFDAGTHFSETRPLSVSPAIVKDFFSRTARTTVDQSSGLREQGTLWTTHSLNIVPATVTQRGTLRIATQNEVITGTLNDAIVTPLTLQNKTSDENKLGIIKTATLNEVITGSSGNIAVPPSHLKNAIQTEKTWEASTTTRGTVTISEKSITFVGNNVAGNTQNLESYVKTGYAVSPYELNKTLMNYLPLKAKAVDSDLLDGIDSTQFIRRDINQEVNGVLTFKKPINVNYDNPEIFITNDTGSGRLTFKSPRRTVITSMNAINDTFGFWDETSSKWMLSYPDADNTIIHNKLTVNDIATFKNDVNFDKNINTKGYINTDNNYKINNQNVIEKQGSVLLYGNNSNQTKIQSNDSSNMIASDSSGSYKIITEKNIIDITDKTFVKKSGDVMTGKLTVNAPIVSTVNNVLSNPNNKPTTNSIGTWSVDILDRVVYESLPGYLVPIFVISESGETLPIIDKYEEFKSVGVLSQFGVSMNTTYQLWSPRPTIKKDGHNTGTTYIRYYNPLINNWDDWGRVYTSAMPPTAADIGAVSGGNTSIGSMKIRDKLQLGNVLFEEDPISKSIKITWVGK